MTEASKASGRTVTPDEIANTIRGAGRAHCAVSHGVDFVKLEMPQRSTKLTPASARDLARWLKTHASKAEKQARDARRPR